MGSYLKARAKKKKNSLIPSNRPLGVHLGQGRAHPLWRPNFYDRIILHICSYDVTGATVFPQPRISDLGDHSAGGMGGQLLWGLL